MPERFNPDDWVARVSLRTGEITYNPAVPDAQEQWHEIIQRGLAIIYRDFWKEMATRPADTEQPKPPDEA